MTSFNWKFNESTFLIDRLWIIATVMQPTVHKSFILLLLHNFHSMAVSLVLWANFQTIGDLWLEFTLVWLMFSVRLVIFSSVSLISFPTSLLFLSSRSCNKCIKWTQQKCILWHMIKLIIHIEGGNISLQVIKPNFSRVVGTLAWWNYIVVFNMLTYLLIFSFCLQQDLLVIFAIKNATLMAHRCSVLFAVINQRLFMAITQLHGLHSIISP